MPEFNSKNIVVCMDMEGCPNRCKHCWLGHTPNKKVSEGTLREVVKEFRNWTRKGDEKPFFEKISVNTWYREPDFAPNYRELWELEKELSDEPMRFELLSIWRLAKDDTYAKWAKEIGTKECQISFFGLEENTDYFVGRKGAFKDNLLATERLLDVGIVPRWQLFLNEKNINELDKFVELIKTLELEKRTEEIGGKFQVFSHIPSPDGESFNIENLRPTKEMISRVPAYLKEMSINHFKVDTFEEIVGSTEEELLPQLINKDTSLANYPNLAFMVTPDLDVYPNMGEPLKWWCIGNLKSDGIDRIMNRFINDEVPGLKVNFKVPISQLAKKYGRSNSQYLYTEEDLIRRWMRMWGEDTLI